MTLTTIPCRGSKVCYRGKRGFWQYWLAPAAEDFCQSGILTCPPANVICTFAAGLSEIGGTLASVIVGAPTPRGIVCTTWLGGSGRPFRRWSYIKSIAWMK
jgi:hypothetical protein